MARKPIEIWTLDCETDPFAKGRSSPQPFLWGAFHKLSGAYHTFGYGGLVLSFFMERRACVYAHNGGRFDFHYLRDGFESEKPILIINGRIAKFKVGQAEFRDSYNLLPIPLAAYQKEEIDYAIFEPGVRDLPENRARIEAYLKSDCVNLAELLEKFFQRFGRPLTQAGCAMSYYVKHYRKGEKPRQNRAQYETYKPYYYGGRVECFEVGYGEMKFTVVDKNSAYPDAMMKPHPASPAAMRRLSYIPSGVERCLVSLRAVSEGAFPYRDEDGALIFPRDKTPREYHVTGWELKAGIELGLVRVLEIVSCHQWDEMEDFTGYIQHFYNERLKCKAEGDKAGDIFNKLLMNSCYGKFASDPSKYNDFMLATPERVLPLQQEGWEVYQAWGDGRFLVYQPQPEGRHWYYNVATAASITGYVRAELLKDLCRAKHLLYCDTDSIAAKEINGLNIGPGLGQWKVEMECDAYAIAGKKMYAFRSANNLYSLSTGEYKVACKGVDLTPAEIVKVAKGGEVLFEPSVPTFSVCRPAPILINRAVIRTGKVQHA